MAALLPPGSELVLASHNAGKLREIAALLAPYGISTRSAADFGLPAPEETEDSFEGNALIKARAVAAGSGLVALADDSGLCIDALGGAPGVYTANWAETIGADGAVHRDWQLAMRLVHERLIAAGAGAKPAAQFVCVLALAWPDGRTRTFRGQVAGTLVWPPRGDRGFGYDPLFVPDGHAQTFAEMAPAAKHAISHRADAFRQLRAALGLG